MTKLERAFVDKPWAKARGGVQVKRLAPEEDEYVLAQSDARIDKEAACDASGCVAVSSA